MSNDIENVQSTELTITPEMGQAIAMAERRPRAVKRFMNVTIEMVTMDEQTAADCLYALPRKERDPITGDQVTKMIEGPSARLAEIICYTWGNCRAEGRVKDDRGDFVIAEGTFVDLEQNSGVRTEIRRRITNKNNQRYGADMIAMTGNAAISIARRNAILAGIPKVFWVKIYEAARKVVAGDSHTLVNRRSSALEHMIKLGVTPEMVVATLNVKSVDEITMDHLATLRGFATAIKDGDATPEEIFGGGKKDDDKPAVTGTPATNGTTGPKNKSAPAPGATTQKARAALKKDNEPLTQTDFDVLRKTIDQAGIGETVIIEMFSVDKLESMTRAQAEEATKYAMTVLAGGAPPPEGK